MVDPLVRDGSEPPSWQSTGAIRLRRRRLGLSVAAGVGLVVGGVLVLVLFGQSIDTYLTFFGDIKVATPAQERRYEVTALACLSLLVFGTVFAVAAARPVVTAVGVVLLVLGVGVAFLFPVPSDRWPQEPAPRPAYDGPVCYSGSDCSETGG